MSLEIWIALAAANFIASLVPGQNAALIGSSTARSGLPGGSFAMAGILAAELIWSVAALVIALGARELSPTLWTALQIGSGIVLLALGLHTLRAAPVDAIDVGRAPRRAHVAAHGLWIGLANPMALVFFLSLFPAFVPVNATAPDLGMLVFYASAVVASSAAGLVPYVIASNALAKGGLAVPLQISCSGMLVLLGGLVLLRLTL